ncbi:MULTISPECIES: SAM-dependent methyltransferase [unclassified Streptomyces]|uniref:SAM-dependent methyltransferase n=1 Tax=unclassified Streptomyces TaxID=2593676 RepID=UPI00236726A2|nr:MULTISPECIES: SAM-dependent methyltransferase [unclassified Streptomyces]MDF3141085.1 SAM-dependent methyltransferase [Streptomyces sp. T21Q-yed]WDF45070.1 SAM-dependent methyltransferase [Streptomyces sp. T12]
MIDVSTPASARMHCYLLGGTDHYTADRLAVGVLRQLHPGAAVQARQARAYAHSALDRLARDGIAQLLDLGCGLPHRPHLHDTVTRRQPGARTVYTDRDPIVLAHGRMMLEESANVRVIKADLSRPGILQHPALQEHLDLTEPVAVTAVNLLEHLDDDAASRLLRDLSALAPASVVVIATPVCADPSRAALITLAMDRAAHGAWGRLRTPQEAKTLHPALSSGLIHAPSAHPQLATALIATTEL